MPWRESSSVIQVPNSWQSTLKRWHLVICHWLLLPRTARPLVLGIALGAAILTAFLVHCGVTEGTRVQESTTGIALPLSNLGQLLPAKEQARLRAALLGQIVASAFLPHFQAAGLQGLALGLSDLALRQAVRELSAEERWRLRDRLHILRQDLASIEQQLVLGIWDYPQYAASLAAGPGVGAIHPGEIAAGTKVFPGSYGTTSVDDDAHLLQWLRYFQDASQPIPEIAIPYYLYEDPAFLAFEKECTFASEGVIGQGNHMGEYWNHQQLKSHRWRVRDPADALVFVVPVYLGVALEGLCGDGKTPKKETVHYGEQLIHNATRALQESAWFKRNGGNDHLFMGTHYNIFWWMRDPSQHPDVIVWRNLIWGRYLASFEESFCQVLAPYSSLHLFETDKHKNLTRTQASMTVDEYLERRPYTFFFVGRVWGEAHATGYDTRRDVFARLPGLMEPNVIVHTGSSPIGVKRCPPWEPQQDVCGMAGLSGCRREHSPDFFLAKGFQAKFHLMIRGDDWGSARLLDIIHFGGIPVILSDGALDKVLMNGCQVDWDQIAIRIPEYEWRNSANIPSLLRKYIPDWTTSAGKLEIAARLRAVQAAQRHLLWSHPESLVAEDFLLNSVRRCLPEAALQRTRWRRPISWWQSDSDIQASPLILADAETQSIWGYNLSSFRPRKPVASLAELTCAFADRGKGTYRPAVFGMSRFQYGWNQDD